MTGGFLGIKEKVSVFVLKKEFNISGPVSAAVLEATALGLYKIEINGKRAGDAYMTPGFTSYRHTLETQSCDVTELLASGANTIEMTVARGWYCGRFGMRPGHEDNLFGSESAGWLNLSVRLADGTALSVVTNADGTWTASESEIRESTIYDGETVDFTAEKKVLTVAEVVCPAENIVPRECEPVRVTERVAAVRMITTPKGETVYDFGQNLTGVVELTVPGNVKAPLTLAHAEILDQDGNFYTENLRTAKAADTFIGCAGKTVRPEFTFHGFRYARLEGAVLPIDCLTALVEHTDLRRTGRIETSSKRFNRLMENVVWSQRDNFLDIPTDCPQRDERMGWTGDANVFCGTAAYNYDVKDFFKKWLRDLRSDQSATGELPCVVPDMLGDITAAAVWGDAVTMIPWRLYTVYGDESFLSDNLEAMEKFLGAVERNCVDGLVAEGFQYGDWLALDKDELMPAMGCGSTDSVYVASAFYSVSLQIVAESAAILGDREKEARYLMRREKLLARMREEYFTPTGRMAAGETQTAMTLALHFGIVPENMRAVVAKNLAANIRAHGYHLTTGFAGTPYVLFALTDNGQHETAERVLMNAGSPGWLYEVDMGATTVWERWNGLSPKGVPFDPGMNSYNHYSYGSVMEYVYRRVAGIECAAPGFKKVILSPRPVQGLCTVRAEYDSPAGKITARYEWSDSVVKFCADIPEGVEAVFRNPATGAEIPCGTGGFETSFLWTKWEPVFYSLDSKVSDVLDNPKILSLFNRVSRNMFSSPRIGEMREKHFRDIVRYLGKDGQRNFQLILDAVNKMLEVGC